MSKQHYQASTTGRSPTSDTSSLVACGSRAAAPRHPGWSFRVRLCNRLPSPPTAHEVKATRPVCWSCHKARSGKNPAPICGDIKYTGSSGLMIFAQPDK